MTEHVPLVEAMREIRSRPRMTDSEKSAAIDMLIQSALISRFPEPEWDFSLDVASRSIRASKVMVVSPGIQGLVPGSERVLDTAALEDAGEGWLELAQGQLI
jgi:hypothetical protein